MVVVVIYRLSVLVYILGKPIRESSCWSLSKAIVQSKIYIHTSGADDNKLRLVFTQMDAQDPSREYFFSVHVDEADHYQVEECNPKLDEALISSLVTQLNTSSDFAGFCKRMRRAFKATIKPN